MSDMIGLKRHGLLDGYRRVVEIGAQQISDRLIVSPSLHEAVEVFGGYPLNLRPTGSATITPASPPGRLLWAALGFQSQSIDIEGGDITIDLNAGTVPEQYRGAFDIAINAGTTEHVANQGNAFATIHDLTRVGGLMYHQVPASGNINHGFFGYQPKFFHRLAKANDYDMVHFAIYKVRDIELPEYLRAQDIPALVPHLNLAIAMVRKGSGGFTMPSDG